MGQGSSGSGVKDLELRLGGKDAKNQKQLKRRGQYEIRENQYIAKEGDLADENLPQRTRLLAHQMGRRRTTLLRAEISSKKRSPANRLFIGGIAEEERVLSST